MVFALGDSQRINTAAAAERGRSMKALTVIYASAWLALKTAYEVMTDPYVLLFASGMMMAHMLHRFW